MNALRIGTRGSPLALWQAHHVAGLLRPLLAPRPVELVEIQTSGDIIRDGCPIDPDTVPREDPETDAAA